MNTDPVPKQVSRKKIYQSSDQMTQILVPPSEPLQARAGLIQVALADGMAGDVERTCQEFADLVAEFFEVPAPPVAVLGVRPHRTREGRCVYEKYGDYTFATTRIRLWMRTAMLHKVTSYGTLLSTLCHELCHHLDVVRFQFKDTPHTRGFYERAALLYHQAKGTPLRPLVWVLLTDGTYRIDWGKTMHGAGPPRRTRR